MAKKGTDYTNIVAEINPIYLYSAFDSVTGIELDTEGAHTFEWDQWNFEITVATQGVTGYCWAKKNWELTGLYEEEVALVPVAANVQTAEPPLLPSKDAANKYMRVAEFWTTRELTRNETKAMVNYAQPTLPGFPGGTITGTDAFMSPEQVISGRSSVYSGNLNFTPDLGFMTLVHQSIIGEGEPCASPDLHYTKAIYFSTNLNDGKVGFILDVPGSRDILTVGKVDMTKESSTWTAQVIRGSDLDAF